MASQVEASPMVATYHPQAGNNTINPVYTTPPHQWTTNMTASSLTSSTNHMAVSSCLDEQIERLKRCEYLREGEVKALCLRAREILVDESNVQRVDAPVTVCPWSLLLVTFTTLFCIDNALSHVYLMGYNVRFVVTFMVNFMIW
jgi:hypothetical protein